MVSEMYKFISECHTFPESVTYLNIGKEKNIHTAVVAPCRAATLTCSQPDTPALLEALRPVLNLSSIRPVQNYSTPTDVNMDFSIYGILGMVRRKSAVLSTQHLNIH